jgi:hypothetical protein
LIPNPANTLEVDFLEIFEDCEEIEEIIRLVPVGEGFYEDTNLVRTQGKPRSLYTY